MQFTRDFPYGTDPNVAVLDTDITSAFNEVDITINPGMWCSQQAYSIGYLYLAAHLMVLNLRNSSQGLNGQYNWLQASKGVSSVSEGFDIPQRIKDNPDFAQYFKTNYGAKYLNMLWPQLGGVFFTVAGRTKP